MNRILFPTLYFILNMKFSMNNTQLLDLIRSELKLDFEAFRVKLILRLHDINPIWSQSKLSAKQFLTIVTELLESEENVSSTLKQLTKQIKPHDFSFPKQKSALEPRLVKPDGKSPRPLPSQGPKRSSNNMKPVTSKCQIPSVKATEPNFLSRRASKVMLASLKSVDLRFNCHELNCLKCNVIRKTAPITKCTHPNPHPSGWFVHVPRKVSRAFHLSEGDLSSLTGLKNPLSTAATEMASLQPKIADVLAQMTSSGPEPMDIPPSNSTEQRRRTNRFSCKRTANRDNEYALCIDDRGNLFQPTNSGYSASIRTGSSSGRTQRTPIYYPKIVRQTGEPVEEVD